MLRVGSFFIEDVLVDHIGIVGRRLALTEIGLLVLGSLL